MIDVASSEARPRARWEPCARIPRSWQACLVLVGLALFNLALSSAKAAAGGWQTDLVVSQPVHGGVVFRDTLFVGDKIGEESNVPVLRAVAHRVFGQWLPCQDPFTHLPTEVAGIGKLVVHDDQLLAVVRIEVERPGRTGLLVREQGWRELELLWSYATVRIDAVLSYAGRLVLAGAFRKPGAELCENVLLLVDGELEPLGVILGWDYVSKMTIHGGELVVASSRQFSRLNEQYLREQVTAHIIQRWDGSGWTVLREGEEGFIGTLLSHDENLYVGFGVRRIPMDYPSVIVHDGNDWHSVGEQLLGDSQSSAQINALAWHRGFLVAGGKFDSNDGHLVENVAFWDGATWRPVGNLVDEASVRWLASTGQTLWCGLLGYWTSGSSTTRDGNQRSAPSSLCYWSGDLPVAADLIPLETPPVAIPTTIPDSLQIRIPFLNGDFSRWRDGVPEGWGNPVREPHWGGQLGGHTDLATLVEPLEGGGIVLRFTGDPRQRVVIAQVFPTDPGRHYRMRVRARATDLVSDGLPVGWDFQLAVGSVWQRVPIRSDQFSWYELTLPAHERTTSGRVTFSCLAQSGRLEIKRVELQEVDPTFVDNFDLLVAEMTEFYPGVRSGIVDWDSLTAHYRPIAARAVNREAFMNMIHEMLRNFADSEIALVTRDSDMIGVWPTHESPSRERFIPSGIDYAELENRLDRFRRYSGFTIGWLEETVGYVQINDTWPYQRDISQEELLTECRSAKGLIIDLRLFLHDSGQVRDMEAELTWAQDFVTSLISGELEVVSRQADGDRPGPPGFVWQDSDSKSVTPESILCLIGPQTVSTGTELARMLSAVPEVTVIGRPTGPPATRQRQLNLPCGIEVQYPSLLVHSVAG
ncbi:MAG: hypothetical protein ABIF77_20845, partial [bacterium]